MPRLRGKYVATCEGDDYWCNPFKLQKQVDFMETHPECYMVGANSERVDTNGNHIGYMVKEMSSGFIDVSEMINKTTKNPHFSSLLFRSSVFNTPMPVFFKLTTGDNAYRLFSATLGKEYYINEVMSVCRVLVPGSWTMRQKNDKRFRMSHTEKTIRFLEEYDKYTGGKYRDTIVEVIHKKELSLLINRRQYREAYQISKTIDIPRKLRAKLFIAHFFPSIRRAE